MLVLIFILGLWNKEILHQTVLNTDVTWEQTDFTCDSYVQCED